jgi:hypothetical protein
MSSDHGLLAVTLRTFFAPILRARLRLHLSLHV